MPHELLLYPVRPTRTEGESLAGFICRHFGSNGHWIPKALHDTVATVYRSESPQMLQQAWELLSKVMGESPDEYRRLWIEDRFTLTQAQAVTLKRHWQKPTARQFRLCPECLQTTGVHLAFWDLPLVFACPIHKRLLVTHCQCGKPFAWANVAPNWTCSCGQSLSSIRARNAPRSLIGIARAIAATTDLHVPGLVHHEVESYRIENDLRCTYEVMAWLKELFRTLRGPSKAKLPANALERWRFGSAFDDWPNGLVRLLRRLMRRWHQSDRNSPLVHLMEHSRTQQLLQLLEEATANAHLPSVLRSALTEIPISLRFSPSAPNEWIFNPALNPVRREDKLHTLLTWWHGLSDWIELCENPRFQETTYPHLEGDEGRICVKLLNVLVAAAEQAMAPPQFRRFAGAWPSMPVHANRLPASQLLELLSQQLMAISSVHRGYLFESALDAVGITHAAT